MPALGWGSVGARSRLGLIRFARIAENLPHGRAAVLPVLVAAARTFVLANIAPREGILVGLLHRIAAFSADHPSLISAAANVR